MKILVLGEHHDGKVKDSTLATLGAAAALGVARLVQAKVGGDDRG